MIDVGSFNVLVKNVTTEDAGNNSSAIVFSFIIEPVLDKNF